MRVRGRHDTPGNLFTHLGRKRLPCGIYNVYLAMFTEFVGGNVHLDGFGCLYPIRNALYYINSRKIHPNGHFPPTNSLNITRWTLCFPQGRRCLPRSANGIPGVHNGSAYGWESVRKTRTT